jgi:hypothetical protein
MKTLLISVVLLAVTASVASAGGINLLWNDCGSLGGGAGVMNRSFACNSNNGNNDLYVSFEPDVNINVSNADLTIDLQSAGTVLPAWWQFKSPGTCRQASLSTRVDPGTCFDLWEQQANFSIAAYFTVANAPQIIPSPNRARILGSVGTGFFVSTVRPGTEYFCFQVRINNQKTVGTGSCAGCQEPVCLVLNELRLSTYDSGDFLLYAPLDSNFATWQGGAIGGPGCPGSTPTLNRTWGRVKTLYR